MNIINLNISIYDIILKCYERWIFVKIINKTENQNIQQLVEKVLEKTKDKKCHGLDKDITICDYDNARVYLKVDGELFTIRIWSIDNAHHDRFTISRSFFGDTMLSSGRSVIIHENTR